MLPDSLLPISTDRYQGAQPLIEWAGRFASLAQSAKDPRIQGYYASGMFAGDTPLRDVDLIALDIQATGPDPMTDEIIAIATVTLTLNEVDHASLRHWSVLAPAPTPDHGLAQAGQPLQDVLGELLATLSKRVVVVHGRTMERSFLNQAINRLLHEPIEMPMIDTLELEARLHRQASTLSLWPGWLSGQTPKAMPLTLSESRERYGLAPHTSEEASEEAIATAELLQAQIAHRFSAETPLNDLWC